MKDWQYRGRWALVTGASAGIGEVFARKLAARGMNVVVTARRLDRLQRLASELESAGVRAVPLEADLADPAAADKLWARASEVAQIDLLINNAGFGAQGEFQDVALGRHLEMLDVNCRSLTVLAYRAIEEMRERSDGGIINVASIAAFQPVPTLATYAASKAYVLSLSEALWAENRDAGIRVLALNPGRTPTEFQEVAGTGSAEGTFGVRTAEQVVDAALEAFEKGASHSTPGWENAMATWAVRAMPRNAVTKAMKRVMKRVW